jgi:hypothetical protein
MHLHNEFYLFPSHPLQIPLALFVFETGGGGGVGGLAELEAPFN